MKKAKSSAPKKSNPTTDAEALSDIVNWSRSTDRPAWQAQALKVIVTSATIEPTKIDELYTLSMNGQPASDPISEADIRTPKATAVITLKSVMNPQDVNALASDQGLTFNDSALTIVYGDNGSGKSGYSRILRQACRARLERNPPPILSNIFEQSPGIPRAKIHYRKNGENRRINWQSGEAAPADLSAISVFDSKTAAVHVDVANEIAYTPYSLEVLQQLAQIAETMRARCKHDAAELMKETPQALRSPPIDDVTIRALITTIDANSDPEQFETLATLSDAERTELASLRQDLSDDPAKAAKRMSNASEGLIRLAGDISDRAKLSGASTLAELQALLNEKRIRREAADVSARLSFKDEPIPHVGTPTWRALWDAARLFALEATPAKDFPPSDGPCPFCQQELEPTASDRLRRFEEFVQNDAKLRADQADAAYGKLVNDLKSKLIPASRLREKIRFIASNLGADIAAQEARILVRAVWQIRRILRLHDRDSFRVEDLDPSTAEAHLNELSVSLSDRANALNAGAASPERIALQGRLNELEARTWISGMLPDIRNEISRKIQLKTLERVESETSTRSVTDKATQLANALVTDALRARFTKEVAALGIGGLAVELKKESSQAGAARFQVRLTRKPDQKVGAVLSEGEHRCVALAAFLAELETSHSKSAIIFDDPVSSLDHLHREQVADRLAEEARHRQVIVMTHDIAFLMLLHKAAQKSQVQVGFRCISRGEDLAGYCDDELPFNARPVEDMLNGIEKDIDNKTILHKRGNKAEWRKAVRGGLEQLREAWERAVEEFIGPVFKRLSTNVDTKHIHLLTVLEVEDCDAMRAAYGSCSKLLHSMSEHLNPRLPTPEEIKAEITQLRTWMADLKARQDKIKVK